MHATPDVMDAGFLHCLAKAFAELAVVIGDEEAGLAMLCSDGFGSRRAWLDWLGFASIRCTVERLTAMPARTKLAWFKTMATASMMRRTVVRVNNGMPSSPQKRERTMFVIQQ